MDSATPSPTIASSEVAVKYAISGVRLPHGLYRTAGGEAN